MPYYRNNRDENGNLSGGRTKYVSTGAVTGSNIKRKYHNKPRRRGNSKLSDTKINTLVEQRMVEIAKKEVEKKLKILTSRKYLFHRYNNLTNEFTILNPRSDLVDWRGNVVELSNIPKTDVETRANVSQLDDPMTSQNEADDGNGQNQLMIGDPINGYRWGDMIYIKSLSANLRIRSLNLTEDDFDQFGTVKVKYAFVLWRDEESTMAQPLVEPQAQQLLRMNPFGYKGSLDKDLEMDFNGLNTRVLCAGECLLNLNDNQTTERWTTIYKKFDKPISIAYVDTDQTGQRCNKKIYFVCRSTIPSPSNFNDIKPSVYVCTKINYYEA